MLIDHLVYAAPDLAAAVTDVEERFGVRARAGGRHIGLGTHNALLALGAQTYLEIIAPDPGQPEPPVPRPFGVDGVSRGGLVSWALARDDIDAAVAWARSHGYDPGEVADGQRTGPTGTVLRWRLTQRDGRRPDPVPDQLGRHRASRQISAAWAYPRGLSPRAPRSLIPRFTAHGPRRGR
jgi:hypothetical protein